MLEYGLPALFVVSLLASSILPLGSEWLLVAMIIQGHAFLPVVLIASLGNYLGACTTYMIGRWGAVFLTTRLLHLDDKQLSRAQALYNRYGIWSLLFSWLPVVGDPLCLLAGTFRLHFLPFSLLVASGKMARYSLVAWLAMAATG